MRLSRVSHALGGEPASPARTHIVIAGAGANRQIEHMDDRSPLRLIWLLLLAPYVGLLWVPFYNARTPELWGFPFFYWYQLIWVPITAALTWLVYRSVRHDD
jgi:hypothetical protein